MPDPFVVVLLTIYGGVAAFYALLSMGLVELGAGNRLRLWRDAARAAGLSRIEEETTALTGWAGELQVRFTRYEDASARGTRLTIAGPALHFVDGRRRREAVNFQPPPWARVVALNAPTPRIRVMPRPPHRTKSPAPMPIRPPDQTERLAHALQQLVDRLQTADRSEPKAVRVRPRGHASM